MKWAYKSVGSMNVYCQYRLHNEFMSYCIALNTLVACKTSKTHIKIDPIFTKFCTNIPCCTNLCFMKKFEWILSCEFFSKTKSCFEILGKTIVQPLLVDGLKLLFRRNRVPSLNSIGNRFILVTRSYLIVFNVCKN